MKQFKMFIGGENVPSITGLYSDVSNPATGEVVALVPQAGPEDIQKALSSNTAGFQRWKILAPTERETILLNCADAIEKAKDIFIETLLMESGSTITKARREVEYSAILIRAAAGEVRRLYGETFPNDNPQRLSMVIREPMGVVAAISPFNAPLALLVKMSIFPIAAGNSVIAKPSRQTPTTAVALAQVLYGAGLPAGVFNVVTGPGAVVGEDLITAKEVKAITFTGSTSVGKAIAQQAGAYLKPTHLELGGNNPLIILEGADLQKAAEAATLGAFTHAGQICMASARILVENSIKQEFCDRFTTVTKNLHLGRLDDPKTAYGPVIEEKSIQKIELHVQEALKGGAQLLSGGARFQGLVYQPTIIDEPDENSLVWQEETFGPVACVKGFSSVEEAIALANDSAYGLSSGVIGGTPADAMFIAKSLHTGAVHLGNHSFQSDALAPVGGVKGSGIGRSGGKYSIEHFTELKWISMEMGQVP